MAGDSVIGRLQAWIPVATDNMVEAMLLGLEKCAEIIDYVADKGNEKLYGFQPFWLCVCTALSVFLAMRIFRKLFCYDGFIPVQKRPTLLKRLRSLPIIRSLVKKKLEAMERGIDKDLNKYFANIPLLDRLPEKKWNVSNIWSAVCQYEDLSPVPWKRGRASGAVYSANDEDLEQLMHRVFAKTLKANPLHADTFCGVRRMEAEIINWVLRLYNAPENASGSLSSGGTESIFLACKTWRDYASATRAITKPEMVVPATAHAAFSKAGDYLRITVVTVPVDKKTFRVNPKAMRRAITKNTIMIVASAPQFPHGMIDAVEEISEIGYSYNIPVHVDCCLGGFLLPFMTEAGFPVQPFDFRLRGVSSISCDTHKYAMSPKGTSVVMYRSKDLHRFQFCVDTDWPGGVYATPTLAGSRSGAMIACCWAALLYHGRLGYVEACRKIIKFARALKDGIRDIEGLEVLGNPEVSVVAFTSTKFHIFDWNHKMFERGWELNKLQFPLGVHMCITSMHVKENILDDFLKDARECATELLESESKVPSESAAIYGAAQDISDRSIVAEIATSYIESCYRLK